MAYLGTCLVALTILASEEASKAPPPQFAEVTVYEILADRCATPPEPPLPKKLEPHQDILKRAPFRPFNRFELTRNSKENLRLPMGQTEKVRLLEDCSLEITPHVSGKKSLLKIVLRQKKKIGNRDVDVDVAKDDSPNSRRLVKTPFKHGNKRIFLFVTFRPH